MSHLSMTCFRCCGMEVKDSLQVLYEVSEHDMFLLRTDVYSVCVAGEIDQSHCFLTASVCVCVSLVSLAGGMWSDLIAFSCFVSFV